MTALDRPKRGEPRPSVRAAPTFGEVSVLSETAQAEACGSQKDILAQVSQLCVNIPVLDSARGYLGRELLTTFGISVVPFGLSRASGKFHAEAVEEDELGFGRRGDATNPHVLDC